MKTKFSEEFRLEVIRDWQRAKADGGRAAGKRVIEDAAALLGLSYEQTTRKLRLPSGRKRSLSEGQADRVAEKEIYARKVWDFVTNCEADGNRMNIVKAYECLRNTNEIPVEVTLKMIYEAIDRLKLKNESLSVPQKFRGRHTPLAMIQLDYSKSRCFQFTREGRIVVNPSQAGKTVQRLWIGAAVDDCSRVCTFKYYIADGESEGFVRDVLIDVMSEKSFVNIATGECRTAKALQGVPGQIYLDRGAGNRSEATDRGLLKLGIKKIIGANEKDSRGRLTRRSNKKARGKVERLFRTIKEGFESELYALHRKGLLPPDISLDYINGKVEEYLERHNTERHPEFSESTKWEVFESAFETIQFPPDDARAYFAADFTVTVSQRLIRVSRDVVFVAPKFIDDGAEVVLARSGKDYYLWHKGERIKLNAQTFSGQREAERKQEVATDMLQEHELRERLARELDLLSGGELTLRTLPEEFGDDKREFFERPRSVEEIKIKARYFMQAVAAKAAKNVIQFERVTV